MATDKKLFFGILLLVVVLIIAGVWLVVLQKQISKEQAGENLAKQRKIIYIFDKSKFCPDSGDCREFGLESRECDEVGDCLSSCGFGCVSRKWIENRVDCEAIWPNFECQCINGLCQRIK